jgi:hypothetical protein
LFLVLGEHPGKEPIDEMCRKLPRPRLENNFDPAGASAGYTTPFSFARQDLREMTELTDSWDFYCPEMPSGFALPTGEEVPRPLRTLVVETEVLPKGEYNGEGSDELPKAPPLREFMNPGVV